MHVNGIRVRRSNTFTFRDADPERDVDADGKPLEARHMCIVRIRDCRRDSDGYLVTDEAPQALKLTMTGSSEGHLRTRNGSRYYVARDGFVYSGAC